MSAIVNYFVEANLGLIFFMLVYWVSLRNETQFAWQRAFLMGAIAFALLFPLIHLPAGLVREVIPSASYSVPTFWLPPLTIEANGVPQEVSANTTWTTISLFYFSITAFFGVAFFYRLVALLILINRTNKTNWNNATVAEVQGQSPTFSFLNFILLGNANLITTDEKEKILRHEYVHVRKFHSIDRLLIDILNVFFWFNPIVSIYKKCLIQLHEYEADADTLTWTDRESYCGLLARQALQSTGFSLANHFTSSLTLKRIAMMNAVRKRIPTWKIISAAVGIALFFVVAACQDQVMTDLKDINKNSASTTVLPPEIQSQLDALVKANPSKEYVVIQLNEEAEAKAKQIGFANAETGTQFPSMNLVKSKDGLAYAIIEKNDQTLAMGKAATGSDSVFTVVDEQPGFPGGLDSLVGFLMKNIHYPESARKAGEQGKVFVQFVITQKGEVVDPDVIKGVSPALNDEALRVVRAFPQWKPGKQKGQAVSVRYVLPINFRI